jgi:hypothetical protein
MYFLDLKLLKLNNFYIIIVSFFFSLQHFSQQKYAVQNLYNTKLENIDIKNVVSNEKITFLIGNNYCLECVTYFYKNVKKSVFIFVIENLSLTEIQKINKLKIRNTFFVLKKDLSSDITNINLIKNNGQTSHFLLYQYDSLSVLSENYTLSKRAINKKLKIYFN